MIPDTSSDVFKDFGTFIQLLSQQTDEVKVVTHLLIQRLKREATLLLSHPITLNVFLV